MRFFPALQKALTMDLSIIFAAGLNLETMIDYICLPFKPYTYAQNMDYIDHRSSSLFTPDGTGRGKR
jgi:hypothetical protein